MDIGFFFAIIIWAAVIVTAFFLLFLVRNRMRPASQPSKDKSSVQYDGRHILEKTIMVVAALFILSFGSAFITVITLINLDHGENPLLLNRVWVPAAFMLNTFVLGLIAFVLGRASASNRKMPTVIGTRQQKTQLNMRRVRGGRKLPPLQQGTKQEMERVLLLFPKRLKHEAQS